MPLLLVEARELCCTLLVGNGVEPLGLGFWFGPCLDPCADKMHPTTCDQCFAPCHMTGHGTAQYYNVLQGATMFDKVLQGTRWYHKALTSTAGYYKKNKVPQGTATHHIILNSSDKRQKNAKNTTVPSEQRKILQVTTTYSEVPTGTTRCRNVERGITRHDNALPKNPTTCYCYNVE